MSVTQQPLRPLAARVPRSAAPPRRPWTLRGCRRTRLRETAADPRLRRTSPAVSQIPWPPWPAEPADGQGEDSLLSEKTGTLPIHPSARPGQHDHTSAAASGWLEQHRLPGGRQHMLDDLHSLPPPGSPTSAPSPISRVIVPPTRRRISTKSRALDVGISASRSVPSVSERWGFPTGPINDATKRSVSVATSSSGGRAREASSGHSLLSTTSFPRSKRPRSCGVRTRPVVQPKK
jgi:hypothetical protein